MEHKLRRVRVYKSIPINNCETEGVMVIFMRGALTRI